MRWPFVSRARYELLEHNYQAVRQNSQNFQEFLTRELNAHTDHLVAEERARYDALLGKYDSLAKLMVGAPPIPVAPLPVEAEPMDELPPQVVLDAMRTISPVRDKTYDANWAFWEANRERAKEHPDAFAEEILDGFTEPALD